MLRCPVTRFEDLNGRHQIGRRLHARTEMRIRQQKSPPVGIFHTDFHGRALDDPGHVIPFPLERRLYLIGGLMRFRSRERPERMQLRIVDRGAKAIGWG